MVFGALAFVGAMIYIFIVVGKVAGGNDNAADMVSAIYNVTVVNAILILVLAGTAYFYVAAEPLAERPYVMILLHASLLLSMISVSVSAIQQLNSAS